MNPSAALAEMPLASLEALATAAASGWVSSNSPRAALSQVVGAHAAAVSDVFRELREQAFTDAQVATLLKSALAARQGAADDRGAHDLVLSGPDAPGVPTADTHAVVQGLFLQAEREIVLVGYAFHNGRLLFERLAERMHQKPGLRVLFHVDVPRKPVDTSLDEMIVLRFAEEFRRRHWPWQPLPEVYYDPRALRTDPSERASLHAKVIVVDRQQALITSANFTEAAQQRNIEAGILSKSAAFAEKVAAYFAALRETGALRPVPFSPRPS
jgi:hypothetical protein